MVDPIQYYMRNEGQYQTERRLLMGSVEHPSAPFKICSCNRCEELIYKHVAKPRFEGYRHINPLVAEGLTDHQYFLCDNTVEAFLFKTRSWGVYKH